ncbi:MAG: hypothetical protein K9M03_00105 [Kiritimatiellales bacterium]|nr:hypothetical protein [Kiritimatiellales bacterium]
MDDFETSLDPFDVAHEAFAQTEAGTEVAEPDLQSLEGEARTLISRLVTLSDSPEALDKGRKLKGDVEHILRTATEDPANAATELESAIIDARSTLEGLQYR